MILILNSLSMILSASADFMTMTAPENVGLHVQACPGLPAVTLRLTDAVLQGLPSTA